MKLFTISPGETVLVCVKGGTVYDPTPLTVVGKKGSMITAKSKNHTVTRNSSFFKSLNQPAITHDNNESQSSGFSSPADQERLSQLLGTGPSLNAPDPAPPNSWVPIMTRLICQVQAILLPFQIIKLVPLNPTVNRFCAGLSENDLLDKFLTYSLEF